MRAHVCERESVMGGGGGMRVGLEEILVFLECVYPGGDLVTAGQTRGAQICMKRGGQHTE